MKKNAQEIRAVLKGCAQGLSAGRIAAKTAIPKTTVQRMISRGKEVNVQYDQAKAIELRSSLRNFESQNEYGYKPCIKRRFQNAETLQSRNQKNSS